MTEEEAFAARHTIEGVKPFFFLRIACLESSLALVQYCFMKEKAVTWCIGVKLAPFSSHAWIEVNGKAVMQNSDIYQKMLEV